jgi:4-hydroxy 2-oxovalerate aldolase
MVRVATYLKDINIAIKTANHACDLGYETTFNIMAISHAYMNELEEVLDRIEAETEAMAVYIVDSFGALYQDQLHFIISKYQMHLQNKAIGLHFHNHQQLAFANTIDGIIKGCTWVDSTLNGFGRAAGNCCTELIMGFLKNPEHDILPILDVIGKYIVPKKKNIEWGYHIPYMITGALNQHPKTAMDQMNLPEEGGKHDYVKFYSNVDELS